MYKLIIEDDEGKTTAVPLIRNEIIIGRDESNTIRLTERNVSRRHAQLWLDNGQIFIKDLQSYNGLWVNGDRVNEQQQVMPGDLLEIGDYHLTIQDEQRADDQGARPSLPPHQGTPPAGLPSLGTTRQDSQDELPPARLVILNPQFKGEGFVLDKEKMSIGRTDDNHIVIDHASVSRNHAEILRDGNSYRIADLESANGVQVNGEDHNECALRWGDIIEFGHVRLRFVAPIESENVEINLAPDEALLAEPVVAATAPGTSSPSAMNFMVIASLAMLLLLGVMVWFLMSSKKTNSNGGTQVANTRQVPPHKRPSQNTLLADSLDEAQQAYGRKNYDKALQILDSILNERADWQPAKDLKAKVDSDKKGFDLYRKGIDLRAQSDWRGAFNIFAKIDANNPHAGDATKAKQEILSELDSHTTKAMQEGRYSDAFQHNALLLDLDPTNAGYKARHVRIQAQIAPKKRVIVKRVRPRPRPRIRKATPRRMEPPARTKAPEKRATKTPKPTKKPIAKKVAKAIAPPERRPDAARKPPARRSAADACKQLYRNKKWSRALRCYKRIPEGEKTAGVYYMLGYLHQTLGHCNKTGSKRYSVIRCYAAVHYYGQFVKIAPNHPRANRVRAILRRAKQNQAKKSRKAPTKKTKTPSTKTP